MNKLTPLNNIEELKIMLNLVLLTVLSLNSKKPHLRESMDMSKAFHTVNHGNLLNHVEESTLPT